MRYTIAFLAMILTGTLSAQSKKQLISQVDQLKKENAQLQSEIEELKKPKTVALTDTLTRISYSLGTLVGDNLKGQGGDSLNVEALSAGLKDVFTGNELQIEMASGMAAVQKYMQARIERKAAKVKLDNIDFLVKNRTAEGVNVTASGLQYKINATGKGKSPKATDKVTVHYTGKLIDGTIFDSSVEGNEPVTLQVNNVIPGWTEALQLMHEGDKWTLYIPYPLGYGERGAGEQVPPYSTLVFDVELIKVN